MKKRKTVIFSFLILCILVALDQWTKLLAVRFLKGQAPFVIFPRILEFSYLENTGAAFSFLAGKQAFLIILTMLVIVAVAFQYAAFPAEGRFTPLRLTTLSILGGAVGNLIDRIGRRYVVDFIYFVPIDFPKFNVADICITVGVAVLAVLILFFYQEEELERAFLWGRGKSK